MEAKTRMAPWLRLEAGAAPYARAIAAVFDAYRGEERSFSSAI